MSASDSVIGSFFEGERFDSSNSNVKAKLTLIFIVVELYIMTGAEDGFRTIFCAFAVAGSSLVGDWVNDNTSTFSAMVGWYT